MTKKRLTFKQNKGMTLVEMIVTFALLAIFIMSAATIIGTVSMMYHSIKAENYSKQVSDIVMDKIESEIDGARYDAENGIGNLRIETAGAEETGENLDSGAAVVLSDKSNTKVKIYAENNELVIHYYPIGTNYGATDWKFDKSVYNFYTITSLEFVRGDKLPEFSKASDYGLTSYGTYDSDVIVVFMRLHHPEYGDYNTYRFIRMYNAKKVDGGGTTGG